MTLFCAEIYLLIFIRLCICKISLQPPFAFFLSSFPALLQPNLPPSLPDFHIWSSFLFIVDIGGWSSTEVFSEFELRLFCLLRFGERVVFMNSIGPVARAEMNGFVLISMAEKNVIILTVTKLYFTE